MNRGAIHAIRNRTLPPRLAPPDRRRRRHGVRLRLAAGARRPTPRTKGVKHKSCILLYMLGGPSHIDTFDLKHDTETGTEFKPIATSVPGIQISEHLPKVARLMHHGAIIRSMNTVESDHDRGRYLMHTGYPRSNGGVAWPSMGALVSSELGQPGFLLPNFVVCNLKDRLDPTFTGYLGAAASGPDPAGPRQGNRRRQAAGEAGRARRPARPAEPARRRLPGQIPRRLDRRASVELSTLRRPDARRKAEGVRPVAGAGRHPEPVHAPPVRPQRHRATTA